MHNGVKESGIPRINVDDYPAIKAHLDAFYPMLIKRFDKGDTPYNLRNCAYMDDFSKQKLVWTPVNSEYRFALLPENYYTNNSLFMIVGGHMEHLCGVLNSGLYIWYFKHILSQGAYAYGSRDFFSAVPVALPIKSSCTDISNYVEKITELVASGMEYTEMQRQLDANICKIYGLSDDETEYVLS